MDTLKRPQPIPNAVPGARELLAYQLTLEGRLRAAHTLLTEIHRRRGLYVTLHQLEELLRLTEVPDA